MGRATQAAGFDAPRALQMAGDDPELLSELLEIYVDDLAERLPRLRDAVSTGDPERTQAESHALKGASRSVAVEAIAALAEALESCGREAAMDRAAPLLCELEACVARLRPVLEEAARASRR